MGTATTCGLPAGGETRAASVATTPRTTIQARLAGSGVRGLTAMAKGECEGADDHGGGGGGGGGQGGYAGSGGGSGMRKHLCGLFPYLPGQPGYGKRLRTLGGLIAAVVTELARRLRPWSPPVHSSRAVPRRRGRGRPSASPSRPFAAENRYR